MGDADRNTAQGSGDPQGPTRAPNAARSRWRQECNSDKGPTEGGTPYPFARGIRAACELCAWHSPKAMTNPSQRDLTKKNRDPTEKWGCVLQTVSRLWPFGLFAPRLAEHTHHGAACPLPPLALSPPRGPGPGMFPAWSRRTASLHFHPGRPPSLWPPGPSMPTRLATPARPRHVNGLAVIDPARPSAAAAWL